MGSLPMVIGRGGSATTSRRRLTRDETISCSPVGLNISTPSSRISVGEGSRPSCYEEV